MPTTEPVGGLRAVGQSPTCASAASIPLERSALPTGISAGACSRIRFPPCGLLAHPNRSLDRARAFSASTSRSRAGAAVCRESSSRGRHRRPRPRRGRTPPRLGAVELRSHSGHGRLGFAQRRDLQIERGGIDVRVIVRQQVERHGRYLRQQAVERGRVGRGRDVIAMASPDRSFVIPRGGNGEDYGFRHAQRLCWSRRLQMTTPAILLSYFETTPVGRGSDKGPTALNVG